MTPLIERLNLVSDRVDDGAMALIDLLLDAKEEIERLQKIERMLKPVGEALVINGAAARTLDIRTYPEVALCAGGGCE